MKNKSILLLVAMLVCYVTVGCGNAESETEGTSSVNVTEDTTTEETTTVETTTEETTTEETTTEVTSDNAATDKDMSEYPVTEETSETEGDGISVIEFTQYMLACGIVEVRKGPGDEYEKLGELQDCDRVKVTGMCSYAPWYRIEYNGKIGYVADGTLGIPTG